MNFANIIFDNPAASADVTALIDERRSVTFGELRDRVGRLAAAMRQHGIAQGDRIAILLGTRIEYVEIYLAAAVMGAIAMPLNTRLAPQEHVLLMRNGEPKMLIADAEWLPVAKQMKSEVPSLETLVAIDQTDQADQADQAGHGEPGNLAYEEILAQAPQPTQPLDLPADEPAVLLYTSGTTSGPKGAILSHRNLIADIEQYQAFVQIPKGSVNLQVSPLYHAANIFTYVHLLAGGTTVFMRKVTADAMFNAIEKYRVNFMFTVPTVLYTLLDAPDRPQRDLSSLQTLEYGAAPIVGPRLESALQILGHKLQHAFGMTETSSHASLLGKADHLTHPGSIGRPLPGVQMRIVDDDGQPLGPDEIGELEIKGDNVIKNYWRNPEATAEVLHDGWLASGDLARRDADGFYYIAGRKKDLIISGGVNIYPSDIENVLADHPVIAEVAVYGLPDAHWGEYVTAAIVLREGMTIDPDELRVFVRQKLGGFKIPKEIRIMETLPRTGTGKLLKRELRILEDGDFIEILKI
ncbi:MAG: long-chain-fatty-acid--CoA ligase [Azonexus sp.]|jgi:fatty-acyl-CoA synthase|nr:long-chain-fatty-acid--CoA ligase [Azonexus sp.]